MAGRIQPITRGDGIVNFGCGFLVAIIGTSATLVYDGSWLGALVVGTIGGLLAAVYGDRFWTSMVTWFS